MKLKPLPDSLLDLFKKAQEARSHSHSPYSQFQVGAAVRTKDGKIFSGTNVENSSFPAGSCAEPVAIYSAVSQGAKEFEEILILTQISPPGSPCGMCLQVMTEFFSPDTKIFLTNLQKEFQEYRLKDLLPRSFTSKELQI